MGNMVSIPAVDNMPNIPAEIPLDFNELAEKFDMYVMNPENDVIYQDEEGSICIKAFLEGEGNELITFGSMMMGRILNGKDVSKFIPSLLSYYNEELGMFLNNRDGEKVEYWYLMHANALAGEIISRCLIGDASYVERWISSVEVIREMAHKINYDFNDQGYDFRNKTVFTMKDSYRQPDTIGGFAYIMLQAYQVTNKEEYLIEAENALKRYEAFEMNPWYEIPNGARACAAAAFLKHLKRPCNLEKVVNFALDSKGGCLQTGKWGEKEINGLMMGWRGYTREEACSSAYSLESLIAAPFLLSVVKYDPSFARTIGKYILNAAANCRLFFSQYVSVEHQSRPMLTQDVPYEKLYSQYEGIAPYAAGDFFSHKSVYGGTFLLWWGAFIHSTEDPYILQINLSKTSFLQEDSSTYYLYYNPYKEEKQISVILGEGMFDFYEMPEKKLLGKNISRYFFLTLKGDQAVVIKCNPVQEA